jgi:hypothetical protein
VLAAATLSSGAVAAASPSYAAVAPSVSSASVTSASLSVSLSDHSITLGDSVTVKGRLHNGSTNLSGAVVVLQRRKSGSSTWYAIASKTTNSSGVVRFTITPGHTGTYYYRLVHYKGTAYAYARSSSTRLHISN